MNVFFIVFYTLSLDVASPPPQNVFISFIITFSLLINLYDICLLQKLHPHSYGRSVGFIIEPGKSWSAMLRILFKFIFPIISRCLIKQSYFHCALKGSK